MHLHCYSTDSGNEGFKWLVDGDVEADDMLNLQADSKLKQLVATKMKRGTCSNDPAIALLFQMDCLAYPLGQH